MHVCACVCVWGIDGNIGQRLSMLIDSVLLVHPLGGTKPHVHMAAKGQPFMGSCMHHRYHYTV